MVSHRVPARTTSIGCKTSKIEAFSSPVVDSIRFDRPIAGPVGVPQLTARGPSTSCSKRHVRGCGRGTHIARSPDCGGDRFQACRDPGPSDPGVRPLDPGRSSKVARPSAEIRWRPASGFRWRSAPPTSTDRGRCLAGPRGRIMGQTTLGSSHGQPNASWVPVPAGESGADAGRAGFYLPVRRSCRRGRPGRGPARSRPCDAGRAGRSSIRWRPTR